MDRLKDTFEAQLSGIEQACREHGHGLKKELRYARMPPPLPLPLTTTSNIYLDLTQDRHSGYFTQAMSEAYEKSKTYSGTSPAPSHPPAPH